MKKLFYIFVVKIFFLSSLYSQNASSNYDSLKNDAQVNIGDITVIEFIESLIENERNKNEISVLLVHGTVDSNWIKKSDVEFLMNLIDSKQDAKCIFNISASLVPKGKSTIGDHAIRLIEVYKSKNKFPDEFLICPKYDRKKRKEIKKWWLLEKKSKSNINY